MTNDTSRRNCRPDAEPRISIVVVTYRSLPFIDRCLAPFINRPDLEIVVWENASCDVIGDHVRAQYPDVRMINSPDNLGFARGNNRAFEHCSGKYILLLNPDAFIDDSTIIDRLADYLDKNPRVAAVGPRLIHEDGSHQVGDAGWRISLGTVVAHAFMMQRLFPALPSLYLTNPSLLDRASLPVDWVCGACMLVRMEVIAQLGGLDEEVFMYGEDIEWCTRMRDGGWQVHYLPGNSVLHLQGATQRERGKAFASVKWLDDVAFRYRQIGSRAGYILLRGAVILGYSVRSIIFYLTYIVTRRQKLQRKAQVMACFVKHVFRLPNFS